MARTMDEKNTDTFRTVVRTTYLESAAAHLAGKVCTETFGPYVSASNSRNYSFRPTVGHVDGEYEIVARQEVWHQQLKPVLALNPSGSLELALDWVTYDHREY